MTPVAFALFIITLVWPLQRRLKTVLPQVIAVLVTAAVSLLVIGGGGWLVVWSFGGIAHWVIANAARLQGLYMHLADLLEQRGLYAAELNRIQQVLIAERFREELDRSSLYCLDGHRDVAISGYKDNRNVNVRRRQLTLKIEPASAGQPDIEHKASGSFRAAFFNEFGD